MSMAILRYVKHTVLGVTGGFFLCVSAVWADPLLEPFATYSDPNAAADAPLLGDPAVSDDAEPALGQALPKPTDPVEKIMHSVVVVEATAREGARTLSTFGEDRKGTGVVLDSNGLIATAGYIVAEAESVKVTFANGITDDAEIVAYDGALGIGLIRTRNFRSTLALELGESSSVKKGVQALILPGSGEDGAVAVTVGKVQPFTGGWEYMLDDAIHTYPPSTDFSGAALISERAELLGLGALVSIDIDIDPKVRVPGNIFIPIDSVKKVMGELLSNGHSASSVRPWLGFETKNTKEGIKVGAVYDDAPAAKSGIKSGDSIVAVNQNQVSQLSEMYSRIWTEHEPGDTVHLLILRDQQFANVPVVTVDRYDWLQLQDTGATDGETKITEMVE